jgi:hypothetical protein
MTDWQRLDAAKKEANSINQSATLNAIIDREKRIIAGIEDLVIAYNDIYKYVDELYIKTGADTPALRNFLVRLKLPSTNNPVYLKLNEHTSIEITLVTSHDFKHDL